MRPLTLGAGSATVCCQVCRVCQLQGQVSRSRCGLCRPGGCSRRRRRPRSARVSDGDCELIVTPPSTRAMRSGLPEGVAAAVIEFLIGALAANPQSRPASARRPRRHLHRSARHLSSALPDQRGRTGARGPPHRTQTRRLPISSTAVTQRRRPRLRYTRMAGRGGIATVSVSPFGPGFVRIETLKPPVASGATPRRQAQAASS